MLDVAVHRGRSVETAAAAAVILNKPLYFFLPGRPSDPNEPENCTRVCVTFKRIRSLISRFSQNTIVYWLVYFFCTWQSFMSHHYRYIQATVLHPRLQSSWGGKTKSCFTNSLTSKWQVQKCVWSRSCSSAVGGYEIDLPFSWSIKSICHRLSPCFGRNVICWLIASWNCLLCVWLLVFCCLSVRRAWDGCIVVLRTPCVGWLCRSGYLVNIILLRVITIF